MIIDFSVTNKILTVKLLHMKKYFLILFVAILNICLTACNSRSNQNGNQNSDNTKNTVAPPDPCEGIDDIDICLDAGGIGNIVIDVSEARNMIRIFKNSFKKHAGMDIRAFEPILWLNKCEIQGIESYLKTQTDPTTKKKFNGVRIFMACETKDNASYGSDPYKRRTSVFIFPTIYSPAAGKSDNKTVKEKIPLSGTCFSPFLQDWTTIAEPQIKEFDIIYRKKGKPEFIDSLTQSIWVDSCVVFTMAKLIGLPNAKIDGININMAAYDKTIITTTPVRGRSVSKDLQSTVILVPTHLVGGKQENYWDITDCLFNNYKANYLKLYGIAPPPGGFNHGELCPQVCD